jgi:hypothetical protein
MTTARIHVFGAAGTGVTTLSRALAEHLGSVSLDTDDYLWAPTEPPYQSMRPIEDRMARLREDTDADSWVWEALWTHGEALSLIDAHWPSSSHWIGKSGSDEFASGNTSASVPASISAERCIKHT